jgi:hypothetical protein
LQRFARDFFVKSARKFFKSAQIFFKSAQKTPEWWVQKIGSVGVGGFCCFASLLGVGFGGGDKGDF